MFNVETTDGIITKIYGDDYEFDFVEKSVSYTTPTALAIMFEDLHGAVTKAVEYNEMKYDLEEMRTRVIGLELDRDTTRKKYQSNLEKEKSISRKLNEERNKLSEKIEELERKHEKAKEYIKELEKILKDTEQELADCRRNNLVLIEQKRKLEDSNKQVAKSRDYWHDEWIKLHNDKNALITANENMSAEIKCLREEISDLNTINKKLNEKNKEQTYGIHYDDLHEMYPCTYSDAAKEILNWIDGEMKNDTDYATKIFNKEDVENIFSITFCKVPVEPEEDDNG